MFVPLKQLFAHKVTQSSFLPTTAKQSHKDTQEPKSDEPSRFGCVKRRKPSEVSLLNSLYCKDNFKLKANCCIDAYSGSNGQPYVLPVVRKAQKDLIADKKLRHEYLPALGDLEYARLASELALGENSPALCEKRALSIHTVACAGAIHLAGNFLVRVLKMRSALVPFPTWECHRAILAHAGFTKIIDYSVWDKKKHKMYFLNMLKEFAEAPEGSLVLLHACAQNPTGVDPTREQWKEIAELLRVKRHFPLFDIAYHGFASGDFDKDAWAVRYFIEQGFELMVAQTFSTCMGLYSERVGCLTVIIKDSKNVKDVASQMAMLARMNYSTPPAHGARTVKRILADEHLRKEWLKTFKSMYKRVRCIRLEFCQHLVDMKTPLAWHHVAQQVGLFTLTDLTHEMIEKLVCERHVYMPSTGSINLCGLNKHNVKYVAGAIDKTVRELIKHDDGGRCEKACN